MNADIFESDRSLNMEPFPKQTFTSEETTKVQPAEEADLLCFSTSKSSPPPAGEGSLLDLEYPTPTTSSSTIDELLSLWEQPTSPSPSHSTSPYNCNPSQPPSYEAVWDS